MVSIALILCSCAGAKLKPFASYTESIGGSTIGIDPQENRFVNVPVGSSWTGGLMLEFPIGPTQEQFVKFDWPRYPLASSRVADDWRRQDPVVEDEKPGEGIEERVVDTVKGVDLWDILKFAAIGILLLIFAYFGVGIWKRFKNGRPPGPVH